MRLEHSSWIKINPNISTNPFVDTNIRNARRHTDKHFYRIWIYLQFFSYVVVAVMLMPGERSLYHVSNNFSIFRNEQIRYRIRHAVTLTNAFSRTEKKLKWIPNKLHSHAHTRATQNSYFSLILLLVGGVWTKRQIIYPDTTSYSLSTVQWLQSTASYPKQTIVCMWSVELKVWRARVCMRVLGRQRAGVIGIFRS